MRSFGWTLLLVVMAALALVLPSSAHPMPNTLIELEVHDARVDAELSIPLIELALARGWGTDSNPEQLATTHREKLARYILQHTRFIAPNGASWQISIGPLKIETADAERGIYAELVAEVTATPPTGASSRAFSLAYDAVIERVATHFAMVTLRADWMAGSHAAETTPHQLGVIQMNRVTGEIAPLPVNLAAGTLWTGFLAMVQLGVSHIAEGTDHLLFLLTLLLPAPLLAVAGRWRSHRGISASLKGIAGIVTAFTLGHSVSLVAASLFRLEIPQPPVEVLIALTILVSACHAIRPPFPGREALVAGLFGLVHGMALSFVLAEMHLSGTEMALSLLGFNLGIELLQLAIVAVVVPVLMILARTPAYAPLRITGAFVAILAALGWTAARLGYANPLSALADNLGTTALPLLALLIMGAVITAASSRLARRPANPD